jgi:hypothetical protein
METKPGLRISLNFIVILFLSTTLLVSGCGSGTVVPNGETTTSSTTPSSSTEITPPTVQITSPAANTTVSTSSITVAGTANDNVGVTQVSWRNATTGATGTASGSNSWSAANIPLQSGGNTITVTARDAAGNQASKSVSVTYTPSTADTTPPTVSSVLPLDRATNVSAISPIGITFSEDMSTATITPTNIRVIGPSGAINGTVGYGSRTAVFQPSAALAASTSYTVSVSRNVADLANNTMAQDFVSTFTTGTAGSGTSACSGFYAPGFTLVSGMNNDPYPTLAKPVKGQAFADPTYHTCVVRATDHKADGTNTFARNDYSRRQAFNADNSKYLIYDANGSWYIYNASTYALIKELTQLGGDAEPQWHPTNPDLLYWLPINGGMVVNELNVVTNVNRVVGNFTGRLPWSGAAHVWTKSEGSPSVDGRYWAFMVENSGFSELGFIVWDMTTDTIVSTYTTSKRPDHLSMSPTGNYVVVSWDDGVTVFNRDFTNPRLVHPRGEHSDIALDTNGDDVYVSIDYEAADGAVYMRNLRTGVRTDLFPTYLNGSATAFHFSGKAFNKPGWALISTYGESGPKQWLHRKVFAVQLRANPTIYDLTHTHEVYQYISSFYFAEVHASVNRDFTKIIFNSNWDVNSGSDVDAYMVEIPPGALN